MLGGRPGGSPITENSINISVSWPSCATWPFVRMKINTLFNTIVNTLYNEFKILVKYSQSNLIILISLFFIILVNNFFGLFPYIFTSSRHI